MVLFFRNYFAASGCTGGRMNVSELSWKRSDLWAKWKLYWLMNEHRFGFWRYRHDPLKRAAAYTTISSTYYSILATGKHQYDSVVHHPFRLLVWFLTWGPLMFLCRMNVGFISDQVLEVVNGDYSKLSADQCDVRQTILRFLKRWDEAKRAIDSGLKDVNAKPHTLALLYLGKAEIAFNEGRWQSVGGLLSIVESHAQHIPLREGGQRARVYRRAARLSTDSNQRLKFWMKAEDAVRTHGLEDQLLKLQI